MPVINVKQLHNDTSGVINEVARQSFDIEKQGKIVATILPADSARSAMWAEIMAPVWAAQKKAAGKSPNPVLLERARRRR